MIQVFRRNLARFSSAKEKMEYDVVIVGGGPAGLSTIKLKQLELHHNRPISVCLIDKGAYIGAHILSGNVFQPTALEELFPNYQNMENPPPLTTPVKKDIFKIYSKTQAYEVPSFLIPPSLHNKNNFIISLSQLTQWLEKQAESLGVEIYSGFSGKELLYNQDRSQVIGIETKEMGISKSNEQKDTFVDSIQLLGKQVVLAEGCRGSLSESVMDNFSLRKGQQSYGLGIKEIWQVDNSEFQEGLVSHGVGWPLGWKNYGGNFIYHMKGGLVHIGLIVGLDYKNPYLNIYEEFQSMKRHPDIQKYLKEGECISYGARTLNEGSYFAIPKLTFPGGMMVGCSAGLLTITKIKGSHNAMKSGIEAAKAIYQFIDSKSEITEYEENLKKTWTFQELYAERNVKKAFKSSMASGILYSGLNGHIFKGREPWNWVNTQKDSQSTEKKEKHKPIQYEKHDGVLTFDLLTNLQRSGTNHDHDQPSHLKIKKGKENTPFKSLNEYDGPETRFCPAKVYEFVEDDKGKKLQINAQNCLHCKACSIKMVDEYIQWTVPEGTGGPNYNGM